MSGPHDKVRRGMTSAFQMAANSVIVGGEEAAAVAVDQNIGSYHRSRKEKAEENYGAASTSFSKMNLSKKDEDGDSFVSSQSTPESLQEQRRSQNLSSSSSLPPKPTPPSSSSAAAAGVSKLRFPVGSSSLVIAPPSSGGEPIRVLRGNFSPSHLAESNSNSSSGGVASDSVRKKSISVDGEEGANIQRQTIQTTTSGRAVSSVPVVAAAVASSGGGSMPTPSKPFLGVGRTGDNFRILPGVELELLSLEKQVQRLAATCAVKSTTIDEVVINVENGICVAQVLLRTVIPAKSMSIGPNPGMNMFFSRVTLTAVRGAPPPAPPPSSSSAAAGGGGNSGTSRPMSAPASGRPLSLDGHTMVIAAGAGGTPTDVGNNNNNSSRIASSTASENEEDKSERGRKSRDDSSSSSSIGDSGSLPAGRGQFLLQCLLRQQGVMAPSDDRASRKSAGIRPATARESSSSIASRSSSSSAAGLGAAVSAHFLNSRRSVSSAGGGSSNGDDEDNESTASLSERQHRMFAFRDNEDFTAASRTPPFLTATEIDSSDDEDDDGLLEPAGMLAEHEQQQQKL